MEGLYTDKTGEHKILIISRKGRRQGFRLNYPWVGLYNCLNNNVFYYKGGEGDTCDNLHKNSTYKKATSYSTNTIEDSFIKVE